VRNGDALALSAGKLSGIGVFYPNKKPSHTDAPFVFVVDDGKQRARDISRLHF